MASEFTAWVAEFKAIDQQRGERDLSVEEARRYVELKELLENRTSSDHGPPSSARASLRVPIAYEAKFDNADGFRNAYLRNISEGGVYIESGDAFAMGDRFVLRITLESPKVALDQRVQVVWVNQRPSPDSGLEAGVGVAFLDLTPETKMQIKAIVHNRLDELTRAPETLS
jgi:uncharacterized protein (TIGR02266 family)